MRKIRGINLAIIILSGMLISVFIFGYIQVNDNKIAKNTYIKKNIDYCKLGTLGISSKGERRGTGLYNVKTIINAYNNVIMDIANTFLFPI